MEEKYSISDAAKQLSVETHALRYWEEELGLAIARNNQGHRYYLKKDIALLRDIKDLKEQGFQLKAIKLLLPDLSRVQQLSPQKRYHLREELNNQIQSEESGHSVRNYPEPARVMPFPPSYSQTSSLDATSSYPTQEEKLHHFEALMRKMIRSVMEDMEKESQEKICDAVTTRLLKEMDYLSRQKEELQQKQIALLKQILQEVQAPLAETASSSETQLQQLQSKKDGREKGKKHKKKFFAKSV